MWTAPSYRELPDGSPMDLTVILQYSSKQIHGYEKPYREVIMNSLDKLALRTINDSLFQQSEVFWEDTVTKETAGDISITLTTSGMKLPKQHCFRYHGRAETARAPLASGELSVMTASVTPTMQ